MVRVPSDLQQIVDAFGASTIGSVTVESDGVTVTMTRGGAPTPGDAFASPRPAADQAGADNPQGPAECAQASPAAGATAAATVAADGQTPACGPTVCDFAGGHAVVSTVVGRVMEPTKKAPAVAVGDTVEEGQALLAVEVLKVAQPIVADTAGTILAIHVAPGDVVEWGMPLVTIG